MWVRTPRGEIVRPVLFAWQCWRSRVVVGHLIVKTGNEDALVQSFGRAVKRFGLPSHTIIDNGFDYSSYVLRGHRPKRRVYRQAGESLDTMEASSPSVT